MPETPCRCPRCETPFTFRDADLDGKWVRCPKCSFPFVPSREAEPVEALPVIEEAEEPFERRSSRRWPGRRQPPDGAAGGRGGPFVFVAAVVAVLAFIAAAVALRPEL